MARGQESRGIRKRKKRYLRKRGKRVRAGFGGKSENGIWEKIAEMREDGKGKKI
jgi:hypothetical protein